MSESPKKNFSAPRNLDAERVVLSAAMQVEDGAAFVARAVDAGLTDTDFFHVNHRPIWRAIAGLSAAGLPTGEVAVLDRLACTDGSKAGETELDEIGGPAFVMAVSSEVEATVHATYYLGVVQQKSLQRQAIGFAEKLQRAVKKPAQTFDETADEYLPHLNELVRLGTVERENSLAEVINEVEDITDRKMRGEITVKDPKALIEWPVGTLNEAFSPLDPYEMDFLTTIFGKPSHGKSAFVQQMAFHNIIRKGRRGLMFLLESTRARTVNQMASQYACWDLRQNFQEQQRDRDDNIFPCRGLDGAARALRFKEGLEKMKQAEAAGLLNMRERSSTISTICQTANMIAQKHGGLDFITVDYLTCILREAHEEKYRTDEVLNQYCYKLLDLGKQLNCPVILVAAVNRGATDDNGGPQIENLAGSSGIEYASIRALAIHRPKEIPGATKDEKIKQTEDREVFVQFANMVKDKGGERGLRWMQFRKRSTTFFGPPAAEYRGRPRKDAQ